MTDRRVGILGSGDVGRTLARGFAGRGWDVLVGTRDPASLGEWAEDAAGATDVAGADGTVAAGDFGDAAAHGDVAVLAVRGDAAADVLELAGPERFAGRLVLDATNPLSFDEAGVGLLFGGTDSLGERVQATLPDATVVKCFNTVSHAQMVDPSFEAETPPMFVCGDDADAKRRTEEILVELGWPGAFDAGDVTAARYLEALVPLWVRAGGVLDTSRHAFAVVE